MGRWIDVTGLEQGESFGAYAAEPTGAAKAAILVIQEIFGVNAGIRAKCDKLASEGYLAIAPDLFWRIERRAEMDPDQKAEMQRAFDFYQKFDFDAAVRDIEATIRHARGATNGGKVGAVGYCMGGFLTYLAATRTDIDASVGYYGAGIDGKLNEAHAIARPLVLHYALKDGYIPQDAIDRVKQGVGTNSHVTIHEYPDVDHGFATETGKRRVEATAKIADGRTAEFFARHLA